MSKVFIIWESSGSYEDYRKSVYKVYSDGLVAMRECDRLNQELKGNKDKMQEMQDMFSDCDSPNCEDCEIKVECKEFYDSNQWEYEEQHDYVVEAFDVEN